MDLVASAMDVTDRGLADAVIVSGRRTGDPANLENLIALRRALPDALIVAGSGVDEQNVQSFWPHVDGIIVGTGVKEGRITSNPVSVRDAERLMAAVADLQPSGGHLDKCVTFGTNQSSDPLLGCL